MSGAGRVTASVTLSNTGKRQGEAVVQLYIRDRISLPTRPIRELRGFQKVALKPGESRQLVFEITASTLARLDELMNEVTDPGEFTIMLGLSSDDPKMLSLPLKFT
jgi:beta-glucosidase